MHATEAPPPATAASTTQTSPAATATRAPDGTLRLRGIIPEPSRRVSWGTDVVDNEGMGKKSSKVCCIYHRPRAYDESSSEESDSSSDESSGDDDGGARPARGSGGHGHSHRGPCKPAKKNAYEKMPKPKGGLKRQ